jgi:hypothetical protein
MRKLAVSIIVLVFFLGLAGGCGDSSKQEKYKLIGARKQHATRIFILCKDSHGEYYVKSLHNSCRVICGKRTLNLEDFATHCKNDCYIAFPGQEKELQIYLKKMEHHEIIPGEP